jgi:predicted RNA methylase
VRSLVSETLSVDVPSWLFWMLKDVVRNAAYEAALKLAVRPNTRVLEIGMGSGILAMMAARAGVKHVYTCEVEPVIAQAARDVIALNRLADRITVFTGHSSMLSAAELGGPVEVVVSEIVSSDLLKEGVLPSLNDATRRLVTPGGVVIPRRKHSRRPRPSSPLRPPPRRRHNRLRPVALQPLVETLLPHPSARSAAGPSQRTCRRSSTSCQSA